MKVLDFKQEIPFRQKINIEGTEFEFSFYWRKLDDTVMLDLYDSDSNLIIEEEEIRYGIPLFFRMLPDTNGNIRSDFPQKLIIPISIDGEYRRVGIETLFKDIILVLEDVKLAKTRLGI